MKDTSCAAAHKASLPEAVNPLPATVPPILTIGDAVRISTLSRRTLAEAIACGRLRVRRVGRRVLVPREALEKFVGCTLS